MNNPSGKVRESKNYGRCIFKYSKANSETKHDEFLSKAINIGIIALNSKQTGRGLQLEDIEKNLKKILRVSEKLSEDAATVIDSYLDEIMEVSKKNPKALSVKMVEDW